MDNGDEERARRLKRGSEPCEGPSTSPLAQQRLEIVRGGQVHIGLQNEAREVDDVRLSLHLPKYELQLFRSRHDDLSDTLARGRGVLQEGKQIR